MKKIKIKLAEKIISINCKYNYTVQACEDYGVESPDSEISVIVSDEDIATEINSSKVSITADCAEFICLYRKIAEQLPKYEKLVVHGAAITYKNSALLFVAPSGTGKSTHIKLWKEIFKDYVDIINGDKPIISIENKEIYVYGTPWAGKENWHKNRNAPLKAICILKQSKNNCIKMADSQAFLLELLKQVYLPKDLIMLKRTLEIFNKIITRIPIYILECDISKDAVRVAYNAIIKS